VTDSATPDVNDRRFDDLTVRELHDIMQLRCDVFVVEQTCVYPEVDGADPEARHVWLERGDAVVSYLRVLDDRRPWRIGRVVTHPDHRGQQLSGKLMAHLLDTHPDEVWELEAQAYLQGWYEKFGFVATGPVFDMDGIDHIPMQRLPAGHPDADDFVYDEMSMFADNAADAGFELPGPVDVRRIDTPLADGRVISSLRFGSAPKIVFVHGTAQNAHTWDTVALALGVDCVAVDLAGHGHSSWRDDRAYDLADLADDVVAVLRSLLEPVVLVGMSLGGMVATRVATLVPELVQRLVTVDITPGVTRAKAKHIHDFVAGPQAFASFGEIFDRTREFNPTRSASSLRRGILHNAERQPDGTWQWRYDRRGRDGEPPPRGDLWLDVEALTMPHLLVRGGSDGSVVDDADIAELAKRRPESRVVVVDGAGHSVQGDRPIELASILASELAAAADPHFPI
jgi:esterase